MKSFVLVYNRPTGTLTYREFPEGKRQEAFAWRSEVQRSVGPGDEVVVFHADQIEDLKATHRRYFEDVSQMGQAIFESKD
jgi:hypothetical protein